MRYFIALSGGCISIGFSRALNFNDDKRIQYISAVEA